MKMNKWIGVQTILSDSPPIKQELLIFDRVAVVGLKLALAVVADQRAREVLRIKTKPELFDFLWLIERGFVLDVDDVLPDTEAIESERFKKYEALRQEQIEEMDSVPFDAIQDRNDFFKCLKQRYRYAD